MTAPGRIELVGGPYDGATIDDEACVAYYVSGVSRIIVAGTSPETIARLAEMDRRGENPSRARYIVVSPGRAEYQPEE